MVNEGMYATGSVPQEEIDRERKLHYPNEVSIGLIEEFGNDPNLALMPQTMTLLDVACGSNPSLLQYVCGKGGSYQGVDILSQKLDELYAAVAGKGYAYELIQADVTEGFPFDVESAQMVHTRFLLMHIADISRHVQVVSDMLSKAWEVAVFMEWDWSTLRWKAGEGEGSSNVHHQMTSVMAGFRNTSYRLMEALGVHPEVGKWLPYLTVFAETNYAKRVEYRVDQRPWGNYAKEVVSLCKMQCELATQRFGSNGMGKMFQEDFSLQANYFERFGAWCQPPAIGILIAYKV